MTPPARSGSDRPSAEPDDRLLIPRWALGVGLGVAVVVGAVWVRQVLPGAGAAPGAAAVGTIPFGAPSWSGDAAPIDAPKPELRSGCAWLIRLPELGALSDKGMMDHSGFLNASPLQVLRDGKALTVHARGDACDDGAAHTTLGVLVRTTADVAGATWTVRWSPELQVLGNRGKAGAHPLWFVFPGMTLELPLPATWDRAWGPPVVNLAAVATKAAQGATITWGSGQADVPAGDGPVQVRLVGDAQAHSLVLHVPADGPALAIHDLAIGEGAAATAILGTVLGATTPATSDDAAVDALAPKVSRAGVPVRTPLTLGKREAACRHVVKRPELEGVSDLRLFERYELIDASPVVIWEDDRPLKPHDRGNDCTGAFAHAPNGLVVRPALDPTTHRYAIGFDDAAQAVVGARGGARATLWWGLPGTTLTWTWKAPLLAGPHDLIVDLVSVGGGSAATLRVGDAVVSLAPDGGERRAPIAGPATADTWTMTLEVPVDGPIVLVRGVEGRARTASP